ncbi:MAG: sterol desaturase family protein [Pseudomonadota bacterium]
MESLVSTFVTAAAFIGEAYIRILPFDFLRYALAAGGVHLIVNIALAGVLAQRKIRAEIATTAQMRREFFASMRTVAIFALSGAVFVAGGMELGLVAIDETTAERGWLYFAFNVAALIILHDAWFYWTHRLIHHPKLFRRLHRLHHKSNNPTPWTAYSFDSGEAVINALYLPVALAIIPSSGLAIFVFLLVMIVKNATGHCGYELFPARRNGRPLLDWLTTVTHHDLHHAQAGWNFGLYFTFWDRIMGTEHPHYHERFSEAVRTPLDGSAVAALRMPRAIG